MIETRFKQTEIGSFPRDWKIEKIGNLTDVFSGGTPSTSNKSFWGGMIPWMNSGELNLKFVYDVEGRITEDGLKSSSTHWIPEQCVLIGLAGQGKTRGTAAINMISLCTNQSIAAIYPSDKFVPMFLYYYIDSIYEELRGMSGGDGGRGGLTKAIIKDVSVPLPVIKEQQNIAFALFDMDSLIEALDKLIAKKEAVKRGTMQQLLTGRKRLPGFSEQFIERKICDLCSVKKGVRVVKDQLTSDGKYPVYQNSLTPLGYYDYFNVSANTSFVIIGGSAGYVGFSENDFWAADDCAYLDCQDKYLSKYLYYTLKLLQSSIMSKVRKASIPRLDRIEIANEVCLISSSSTEIQAIAEILTDMDNEIEALRQKKEKYEKIKQGMMQQLLTGRIRLIDDKSAEILDSVRGSR